MTQQSEPTEVDAIVLEIADLIARDVWCPGRSDREFATRKGVTVSAVRNWSAQATRHLRLMLAPNREELRSKLLASAEGIRQMALARQKYQDVYETIREQRPDGTTRDRVIRKSILVSAPDLDVMLRANELKARLFGLMAPNETQQTVVVTTGEASPMNAAALVRAAFGSAGTNSDIHDDANGNGNGHGIIDTTADVDDDGGGAPPVPPSPARH